MGSGGGGEGYMVSGWLFRVGSRWVGEFIKTHLLWGIRILTVFFKFQNV